MSAADNEIAARTDPGAPVFRAPVFNWNIDQWERQKADYADFRTGD